MLLRWVSRLVLLWRIGWLMLLWRRRGEVGRVLDRGSALNSASVASTAVAALATAIGGRRGLGRPPAVHLVLAIRVELATVPVSSVR